MLKTTAALLDDLAEAEQVVQLLVDAGFRRDDISIVANRQMRTNIGPVDNIGAEGRVGGGMAIGGTAGLTAGIVALVIPGIGPVLAVRPLAAALGRAGLGA